MSILPPNALDIIRAETADAHHALEQQLEVSRLREGPAAERSTVNRPAVPVLLELPS